MKHLLLNNRGFREVVKAFEKHLHDRGYSTPSQSMLPTCVQEFLYCMEEKGITDMRWVEPTHIQNHYHYICKRPNTKMEGGLSSSMINHHMYAIRLFFGWLQQMDVILINPISGLDFPRTEYNPREALTINEVQALYEHAETHRDRAILGIYYGCGLRRSEGQQLNRADIDFNRQVLIVRKGKFGKRREVPMHPKVSRHLKDYWTFERIGYIRNHTEDNMKAFLLNNNGDRLLGATANDRIHTLADKALIESPVCLHVLRHSIATHLKQNGMPIEQVQDFLGHASLDVTQGYMHRYRYDTRKNNRY